MYSKVNDSLNIHVGKWEDNLNWLYFSPHFQHCYQYAIVFNQYMTLVYMSGNGNKYLSMVMITVWGTVMVLLVTALHCTAKFLVVGWNPIVVCTCGVFHSSLKVFSPTISFSKRVPKQSNRLLT